MRLEDRIQHAEKGNKTAQFNLGLSYKTGDGVSKDLNEATKWLTKSAEQGLVNAQSALGSLYLENGKTPQDYDKAVMWYSRAAEQGYVDAFVMLAHTYSIGEKVPQDYKKAFRWYNKAAEQGDSEACFNLGDMFAKGQGVKKDYVIAYAWMKVCELNLFDNESNRELYQRLLSFRKKMTEDQIYESLQRTLNFRLGGSMEAKTLTTLDKIINDALDEDSIIYIDKDGETLACTTGSERLLTGWTRSICENGQIRTLSQYKDGRLDGMFCSWWEETFEKSSEMTWRNGCLHGLSYKYYKNGDLHQRCMFKDGRTLTAITWKPNREMCPFSNVAEGQGSLVTYSEDGTEPQINFIVDGISSPFPELTDEQKKYFPDDLL